MYVLFDSRFIRLMLETKMVDHGGLKIQKNFSLKGIFTMYLTLGSVLIILNYVG